MSVEQPTDSPTRGELVRENEFQLIDVWRMLLRQKKAIIGTTIVSVACATVFLLMEPPQWEATAMVQVGQIGQLLQTEHPVLVETMARTADRMQLTPLFQNEVLKNAKIPQDTKEGELYRHSIKVEIRPNSELLQLKIRAYTSADASLMADATVRHLEAIHEKLAAPTLMLLHTQLDTVNQALENALSEREKLMQAATTVEGNRNTGERALMMSLATASQNTLIQELQRRKLAQENQLSPSRTFPTTLLQDISVSSAPIFPSKNIVLILAIIGGLILGAFLASILDSIKN